MKQQDQLGICKYLLIAFGVASCSMAPELPASKAGPGDEAWPSLLTIEQLSSLTDGLDGRPPEVNEENRTLAERSAALRARAAGLRASVLSDAERRRLMEATATP